MAKRQAEDTLLHDSPSKRCYRSLCSVDVQTGSMAPSQDASPHYFEEKEKREEAAAVYLKPTKCDIRKHATQVLTKVQTSGSLHDASTRTSSKKRAREECTCPETTLPKSKNKANEDTNAEDCTYNSFQYWRVPLPPLDLSLLEDNTDHTQTQNKSKDKYSSSDAMET